ncbi:LCP family protein [Streptomyces noursei]|uniref:LCP family protein n=1 Tax=Streptomyces noursei TaxID=1971 RepID=UPI001672F019|nr:LCP family protein [Streptomyces noursei]MCZ1016160.1 LCP family protein [Streptomyces noursei]GGX01817.1 transcriptional regulator [Streptomyces noursei]
MPQSGVRRDGQRQEPEPQRLGWKAGGFANKGLPPDAPDWAADGAVGSLASDADGGPPDDGPTGGRARRRKANRADKANKAARADGSGKGGKGRRVLRWTALGLGVLLVAGAAGGYLYYQHLNANLRKEALDLGPGGLKKPEPNAFGQTPMNILLLGSDGRNTEKNIELGGARQDADRKPLADVQMLVHVSADRSNMSVISIPRDTRVAIPQCTDPKDGHTYPETTAAINESLQHGGPGCTVATWKALTGIYIDHFMMVDFAGVVDMADAVGGVPVCVDRNVYSHDRKGHGSGLKLTKGTHSVQGVQALQWLRTRYGFEDNTDIGRAKAQHMYMNSMIRQLKQGTKLTDPVQLRDLAEAATSALTVDEGLGSVKKLYDLGGDLQRVPAQRITMITMPWEYGPGERYVVPKPGDAEATFGMLRGDVALDGKDTKKKPEPAPSPSTPKDKLAVVVQNGTDGARGPAGGRANDIQERLVALGYAGARTDSRLTSQADTALLYKGAAQRGDALALAKALGLPGSSVRESSSVSTMRLVVGEDWRTGTEFPAASGAGGGASAHQAPKSADPLNAEKDSSACMKVNPQYTF